MVLTFDGRITCCKARREWNAFLGTASQSATLKSTLRNCQHKSRSCLKSEFPFTESLPVSFSSVAAAFCSAESSFMPLTVCAVSCPASAKAAKSERIGFMEIGCELKRIISRVIGFEQSGVGLLKT